MLTSSSADASIGGEATGAMSWAFITSLRKNPNQSYVQLLNSIRDELEGKYQQKPQLSCSHPLSTFIIGLRDAPLLLTSLTRCRSLVCHVDAYSVDCTCGTRTDVTEWLEGFRAQKWNASWLLMTVYIVHVNTSAAKLLWSLLACLTTRDALACYRSRNRQGCKWLRCVLDCEMRMHVYPSARTGTAR